MLDETRAPSRRRTLALTLLATGLSLIAGAALWLFLTGEADIRYSADHDETVPMWTRWVPPLVGILLIRLIPPTRYAGTRELLAGQTTRRRVPYTEALVLAGLAVLFAAALRGLGGGEPAHTLLKLSLLLAAPLVLFWWLRRSGTAWAAGEQRPEPWNRWAPAIPVIAWFALSYTGPFAMPYSDYASTVDVPTLLVTIIVVFLVNSLLEEVFYRRWLQTRWEAVLGAWPAIVLTSLLWASWHVGIQGGGDLSVDLASTFVNQGVTGLFLGYLWSRYRRMWPLLVVHGLINSAAILLGLL
ncbi:membrane protease YdiL (CAAX protease family) [Lipingzhangella halophila]|uniref:Membrane protease YdiL (CAAX protease family) n=1 Tax=Lipingzhangella halophila TaxID=1783352 RepID=A0A7W7RNM5_9ACTN|nr:CPBP family intramembrane glutamic endopeptidase [Lipingzhangella halophila]MBB4935314.1 membrane protease YdiL (CAAX protease family) [Lipingzhangella halophila]